MTDKSNEAKTMRTLPSSPPLPNIATFLHDIQIAMENKMSKMKISIESSIEEKIAKTIEMDKKTNASAAASGIE